jgi:hypothetical protein
VYKLNSVLLSLLTFFVGLFVGNRLAIGRDKRKEFNEAAQPIRAWLLKEVGQPSPYSPRPNSIQIDAFASYLQFWKRYRFLESYKRQDCARQDAMEQDSIGSVFYRDDKYIKECLNALLRYTKRR